MLLGCDFEHTYSDYDKDHMVINLKDFTYNNEIETFLANALNKNTEQDTKIKNLEKKINQVEIYLSKELIY